ncbi:MAG: IS481 family transposase [Candidatus Bipolaricaulia bacterium]
MTLEDKVHAFRLHVLQRAEELGNVSAACREAGISRTLYYRWRKRFTLYGMDGLHPRRTAARPGRRPALDSTKERKIIAMALTWPGWGPGRLSLQLQQEGILISQSTIWRALHRLGLGTRAQRFLVLEMHSAKHAGLVTERTRRNLSERKVRHVQAERPGELVCIDTFYIGNLKGVGKLWQLTACDAASSYAMAKVVPVNNAAEAASFLRDVVAVEVEKAGWKLWRVLTDGGSEFKAQFDQACRELNVRHTRTKPRHAWTNGFVERLQGTILHEHWRIAFRRRYFRRRQQLQASLGSFIQFYNFQRPHQGYRTKGRTPAEIFWGAVREQRHEEA